MWKCEDCAEQAPPHMRRTVMMQCCEFQCATQVALQLCVECQTMRWEHFLLNNKPDGSLTEEQLWQGFSIWLYHFTRCSKVQK